MKVGLKIFTIISLSFVFFAINIIPHIDVPFKVFLISKTLIFLILTKEIFSFIAWLFYLNLNENHKTYFISACIVFLTILSIEIVFTFIPKSHGVGHTYASKLWFQKYWKNTLNSFGYRDKEPLLDKESIFFIGDSFTAGHGIINTEDRVSNLVGAKLKKYQSINLGINGADSKKEYKAMINFIEKSGIPPKKLILQYYGNDIEHSAYFYGAPLINVKPYKNLNFFLKQTVTGSCAINYLYWMSPEQNNFDYTGFIKKAYKSKDVFNNHIEDLNKFIKFSIKHNIEMIVIIYPFLNDIEMSKKVYCKKIESFFQKNKISTINVSNYLNNIEKENLYVNICDPHPSVFLNNIVAKRVLLELNR